MFFSRISLLAVLLLVSSDLYALTYRMLEQGLDYATLQSDGDAKLHILKVDLKRYKVRVLDARDMQSTALPVKSLAKKYRAVAAINANFFDIQNHPLGLVLQEGKLKNPPKNISWWASLLIKGDQASIQKGTEKKTILDYETGIQAGPRLVVAGRTQKLKEEFSPKSAVGIDRQGKLVFIVSEGSIEINQLARLLAKKEKEGGAGLLNVLNLDGGSSTQFFGAAKDWNLSIQGLSSVPIALGLFRK